MIKCEKCGRGMPYININEFLKDDSDADIERPYAKCAANAIVIETDHAWTGYDLSEEEQIETIKCPFCHKFPFEAETIFVKKIVEITCIKRSEQE